MEMAVKGGPLYQVSEYPPGGKYLRRLNSGFEIMQRVVCHSWSLDISSSRNYLVINSSSMGRSNCNFISVKIFL